MKTLKLAVVALSLGFFAASCGGDAAVETPVTDTVATQPEVTPEATTTTVDTTVAPVTGDTTVKTTTTEEVKH